MRFEPKTEEEASAFKMLKPGECDFTVVSADDKQSDKGNDMIELKLEVFDADGQKSIVFDYLLEKMALKLRHFCYAIGLGDKYEAGDVQAEDCLTGAGRCIIRTEKGTNGYKDKNSVADYVVDGDDPMGPEPTAQRSAPARHSNAQPPKRPAPPSTPPAAAKTPKILAWEKFCKDRPGKQADDLAADWRKEIANVFKGKSAKDLSEAEWTRFHSHLLKPAVELPPELLDSATFKDDEIPF